MSTRFGEDLPWGWGRVSSFKFYDPSFSRYHNDSHPLSLPFFSYSSYDACLWERRRRQDIYWTWWTTRNSTLVGLRTHWEQTPIYPGDTLRTHWEQLSNLFIKYPGGKFWICSECAHHFDHTLIAGQILNLISKNPSIYPVGILSQNPGVSFIICPQHVWATHEKFFQNLLRNLFSFCLTTYPVG